MDLGKKAARVYTSSNVAFLRRAKELMQDGCQVRKAVGITELAAEIEAEAAGIPL